MDKLTFKDYVEKRYNDQLEYYLSASKTNQKKYKNFQWTIIVLSTLTTIMAALPDSLMLFKSIRIEFKYLIVLTSGLVTILTAGLKTFKYEELWFNYRRTAEKLKPHIFFYHLNIGKYGKAGVNKEAVFVETIEDILNKEKSEWHSIKAAGDQTNQQTLEEMQAKLDNLVREQFHTVKPQPGNPPVETIIPETTEPTTDSEISGEEGNDGPAENPDITEEVTDTSADMVEATTENIEDTLNTTDEIDTGETGSSSIEKNQPDSNSGKI
jgi:Protein of unknown function (DUF4231)